MKFFVLGLLAGAALIGSEARAADPDLKYYTTIAETEVTTDLSAGAITTIDRLPENGTVQLNGIIEKVEDQKEFRLADGTGEISVNLASDLDLKKGGMVNVIGSVSNVLGFEEIDDATVTTVTASTLAADKKAAESIPR